MQPIMATKTETANWNALLEAIAPAKEYLSDRARLKQTQKEIDQAVDELPQPCGQAVRMRYEEGKTIKEIAQALDIPLWKARRFLYHGRHLLRVQFKSTIDEYARQLMYGELPNRVRY